MIGGTGALPVMDEVKREAAWLKIKLHVLPTAKAIAALKKSPGETNAMLHVTLLSDSLANALLLSPALA